MLLCAQYFASYQLGLSPHALTSIKSAGQNNTQRVKDPRLIQISRYSDVTGDVRVLQPSVSPRRANSVLYQSMRDLSIRVDTSMTCFSSNTSKNFPWVSSFHQCCIFMYDLQIIQHNFAISTTVSAPTNLWLVHHVGIVKTRRLKDVTFGTMLTSSANPSNFVNDGQFDQNLVT